MAMIECWIRPAYSTNGACELSLRLGCRWIAESSSIRRPAIALADCLLAALFCFFDVAAFFMPPSNCGKKPNSEVLCFFILPDSQLANVTEPQMAIERKRHCVRNDALLTTQTPVTKIIVDVVDEFCLRCGALTIFPLNFELLRRWALGPATTPASI